MHALVTLIYFRLFALKMALFKLLKVSKNVFFLLCRATCCKSGLHYTSRWQLLSCSESSQAICLCVTVMCRCCIDALRCRSRPSEQTDTKVSFSCHAVLRRFSSLFMRESRVSLTDTFSTSHASSPLCDFNSTHRCRLKQIYFSNACSSEMCCCSIIHSLI